MSSLWPIFLSHAGRDIHKWKHYFPAYEAHFGRYVNRPVTMLEIGVFKGGSLQMWKKYFGPHAQIVGIDINPDVAAFEEDQIAIRIGAQQDPAFLDSVVEEFGPIDIVLDDGSHVMDHMAASFRHLYPRMAPTGVYMAEDCCTAYWPPYGGGLKREGTIIELAKGLIDELNGDHFEGGATDFTRSSLSIHFYDSVVAFERGAHIKKGHMHSSTYVKASRGE